MNKYNNSVVYKITSIHTNKIYVGSTTEDIEIRFKKHVSAYNCFENKTNVKYCSAFEIIKLGDCSIEIIEKLNVNTKEELRTVENKYYDSLENVVNKIRPYATEESIKTRGKKYRLDNKEEIKEKKKKQYEENKEIIKTKHKNYYETNKDKIREKMNTVVSCECGSQTTQGHLKRHIESPKHQNYLNKIEKVTQIKCPCGVIYKTRVTGKHLKSVKHVNYMNSLNQQE